uniref:2-isopropylmalate synthase n=1 Tax=Heterosigma akashiwo TaxID=2829 RepID=A0A6V1NWK8_HETAK|mmetsp:Transcript_24760/g.34248  ORF Transcript_24760/g.34248 Transcript_24760/m.34248 type:complete len:614 (+) Transcript_24760:93-1934(+)
MERWMQAVYVIFITLALASHLAQAFTFPGKATIQRMQSASVVSKGLSMVIKDPVGGKVQDICVKPTAHDLATGRDPTRVKVFDTTLRDGEQSPGCTMTEEEKIAVAKQLARLGVDVIEAGFPFASPGDFKAVKRIAESVGRLENPPIICGLARALKADIEACAEAVKPAKFPRIHTFIATSDIHMEAKLKKTREQVVAITREMVGLARSLVEDVEFSAEDALRSDPDFLCEVYSVAIEAGATTINVPDTVGYTTPDEFYALMHKLRAGVRGIDQVTISVHGHDDLGMAVANFLAAIEGGARQVECTINGIGERAGNAALEEVVMALNVRKAHYNPAFGRATDDERALTNVNTREIYKTSRLVSSMTGMMVQPNKAIVGANAFAHESGIHQDGVLKNKRTYEIMDAETVGLDDNLLVLGKHSGRAAFRARLTELGYEMAEEELMRAFSRFKVLADVKKEITNMDLEAIVNDEIRADVNDRFKLDTIQVLCGDANIPTATARILDTQTGSEIVTNSIGTGPVDAAFKCILEAVKVQDVKLQEYAVSSVTAGIDALGEVTVRLLDLTSGKVFFGRASNTDVVVASAQAYINACNRVQISRETLPVKPLHPQRDSGV